MVTAVHTSCQPRPLQRTSCTATCSDRWGANHRTRTRVCRMRHAWSSWFWRKNAMNSDTQRLVNTMNGNSYGRTTTPRTRVGEVVVHPMAFTDGHARGQHEPKHASAYVHMERRHARQAMRVRQPGLGFGQREWIPRACTLPILHRHKLVHECDSLELGGRRELSQAISARLRVNVHRGVPPQLQRHQTTYCASAWPSASMELRSRGSTPGFDVLPSFNNGADPGSRRCMA